METLKTNLSLRDGQQSTLAVTDWVLDTAKMASVLAATEKAGFNSAEIAGGQSFQTAISNGYNPFVISDALNNAIVRENGEKSIDLQMLFRGANALGFRHYDKDVVEATLREFIKNGISKIRFFDALNDIDNLYLPDSVKGLAGVTLQGAICFGHYSQAPARYTDEYFVSYAKQLVEKGFSHIAIKDMSGQMTAERMATLLPSLQAYLKPLGIPIELHIHSTNATTSKEAAAKAIELGIDSIETVEGPLAGGSSHHSLADFAPQLISNNTTYQELLTKSKRIWPTPHRKDDDIEPQLKKQLCAAGVPGGAMPFVIRDLRTQMPTIVAKYQKLKAGKNENKFAIGKTNKVAVKPAGSLSFNDVVSLFIVELKRVCHDAAYPLLVTPTADICCKQAIANLAFGKNPYSDKLEDRYLTANGDTGADPRFTKLILGHYGAFKSYEPNREDFKPDGKVLSFFEAHNPLDLKRALQHPSLRQKGNDMQDARAAAWKLIQTEGPKALSFANFDQLTLMYALKPASAPSVDPIANAVDAYAKRSDKARVGGTGVTFPGYETIMQPILEHLGALYAVKPELVPADVMQTKLADLGRNLYRRLFRTYATLTITQEVTRVRNNLTNLVSSDHTNETLKHAVAHVGDSFRNLDFLPDNQGEAAYERAREHFRQLTLCELFGTLALTHSLVNSIDKHGTDPSKPAERAITREDITFYANSKPDSSASEWEKRLQLAISTRHFQVENDLRKRVKAWQSI
jgi:pyruvate/oxaloacetate carboxyltransferase